MILASSKAPVTVKGGQAGRAPAQKKKTKNKNPKVSKRSPPQAIPEIRTTNDATGRPEVRSVYNASCDFVAEALPFPRSSPGRRRSLS